MKKKDYSSNTLRLGLIIFAIVGLIDASYLTYHHYTNSKLICNLSSCDVVLSSSYSVIFGIPVALFGIVFYLVVLAMSLYFLIRKTYNHLLLIWASIGLISTFYLLIIQGFILHAWCQYCILSAITSFSIFLASVFLAQHARKTKQLEHTQRD